MNVRLLAAAAVLAAFVFQTGGASAALSANGPSLDGQRGDLPQIPASPAAGGFQPRQQ